MKNAKTYIKLSLFILAIGILTACKTFTLVEKGQFTDPVGMNVKPEINWNQHKYTNKEYAWTIDGEILNQVLFLSAGENEYFLPFKNRWGLTDPKSPQFNKNITLLEIPDLFVKGVESFGAQLTILNIDSVIFLDNDGFKLNFEFITADGLEKLGIVYGTIVNDRLYIMAYGGAVIEFYGKGVSDFIQMAESATL